MVNCKKEEIMKKILNISLILFVFCLTSLVGGFFATPFYSSAVDTTPQEVYISSAENLRDYVNTGSFKDSENKTITAKEDDLIFLTADIDMSTLNTTAKPTDGVLTKTIGTEGKPFSGVFDGRGYTISNLQIDVSVDTTEDGVTIQNNQYAALFGVTNGATIKNIAIAGTEKLTTGGTISAYAGSLIGKAQNTKVVYAQMTAKTILSDSCFDSNLYFGLVAGYAIDCEFSNIICRSATAFGDWNFSRNDGKISNIGAVVGNLSNSSLLFVVSSVKFIVTVGKDFVGTLAVGGIAGNINQGGSKIVNAACDNSFSYENNSLSSDSARVYVGEIAGTISNPTPISKNLSYIHFKQNTGIDRFGKMGDYAYVDESNFDYITVSTYELNRLESSISVPSYFDNQLWHPLYDWDFDSVWYVGSSNIYLQAFYGNFSIKISNNLDTSVLKMASILKDSYRYGDVVEMKFEFVKANDDETSTVDMSKYYSLSSVLLNGTEKLKISTLESSYTLSDTSLMEIKKDENNANFTLTIKGANRATAGEYSIAISSKKGFKAHITTKLFKDEKNEATGLIEEVEQSDIPGFVFYSEGSNKDTKTFDIQNMIYGQTYIIETKGAQNKPNIFVGWFLKNPDGKDIQLDKNAASVNKILNFVFGVDKNINSSCEIYAKYKDNACVVTFKIDNGVMKLVLNSDEANPVTKTNETVSILKGESLKLEIFIKKGYSFDVNEFIKFFDIYKGGDNFCTLAEEPYENDEYQHYQFVLNIRILKDDFENSFPINVNTTVKENNNNSWIWIVVGSVGGALVVGLTIFLIVYFTRRKGFGGGKSGGGSFKKKNYKNMYY